MQWVDNGRALCNNCEGIIYSPSILYTQSSQCKRVKAPYPMQSKGSTIESIDICYKSIFTAEYYMKFTTGSVRNLVHQVRSGVPGGLRVRK